MPDRTSFVDDAYPAVSRACQYVADQLKAHEARAGGWRLPPVTTLAHMAGVSRSTMIKALSVLKEKGLIATRERRATTAGISNIESSFLAPYASRWEQKRREIEKDLLSGAWGTGGEVPRFKELRNRYGACFRTLRKIFDTMHRDGVLSRHGKKLRLARESPAGSSRRIVFITIKDHLSQLSALNREHNRIVNVFENDALQLGLRIDVFKLDFYDPKQCHRCLADLGQADTIAGFVFDAWWYESPEYRRTCIDVIDRLLQHKKPIAVLDEFGTFVLPDRLCLNHLIQVYRIQGSKAGERIARFALEHGHRSAAYISAVHWAPWSQERFAGIHSQFDRAGLSGKLYLVPGTTEIHLPYALTASGLPDTVVRRMIALGRTPLQAADLESQWERFKKVKHKPYSGIPRLDVSVIEKLMQLTKTLPAQSPSDFTEHTLTGALTFLNNRLFYQVLGPLFDKAISIHDVTLWICATDETAFLALDYLKKHGIRIPDEISVVGFDNVPMEALARGLTSFDFNSRAFVQMMLNFILRPPRPRGMFWHRVIEIEGIIVERETTRKPIHYQTEN